MTHFRLLITMMLVLGVIPIINGQQDTLQMHISIAEHTKLTYRKDYLNYITDTYGWIFSYNASKVQVDEEVQLKERSGLIYTLLENVFYPDQIQLTFILPNKIIIQHSGKSRSNDFRLSGIIKDAETSEAIYGAVVRDKESGISALTNEKGYFIMQIPAGKHRIEASYLGYEPTAMEVVLDKNTFIQLGMSGSYFLDTIHIHDPASKLQLTDGGNLMEIFKMRTFQSVSGETDIVNNARILPGVISGGEGLSGLYVRGGTPDQNLTMIDGVAMYETGHLLGITSVFMDEAIKEASFIKNGFPARYGGRISSVLDITLKEGDKEKNNTKITAGFSGLKVHTNGPIIKNKLTYSISGRASWLNLYVNSLLKMYTKYDNIDLRYHDMLGKFTYHFTPYNSLSLTLYNGGDKFSLTKSSTLMTDNEGYTLNVFDKNGISWSNNIASLKWNYLAGDRLNIKTQIGYIDYTNNARSSYIFNNILPDTSRVDQLDILSFTNIRDFNVGVDVDYYLNDNHVLRSGAKVLKQTFNPTIKQSTIMLEDDAEKFVDRDSSIQSTQVQIYIEDNFKWNDKLFIYAGFHSGIFDVKNKTYFSLQPRFKSIWSITPKHMLSISYSRMVQFTHLLSNSGLGLPSNLWVPSTENINPQYSDQVSLGYTYDIAKGFYVQLGTYSRKMNNVLEYSTPVDMFYFLINDQNITTIFNTAKDWERHVYSGSGTSKGFEFLLHKNTGIWNGWAAVTKSKTLRVIPDINQGKAFPASNDKLWDVNLGLDVKLSRSWNVGANFVYNTGNAFSLSTEEYDSYLGIKLLNSDGKNNYRLPDFHQLSLSALYRHQGKKVSTDVSFKLYNVYNRLNAYYIYIYKSNLSPDTPLFKKVSILPFTPSLSVCLTF